MIMDIAIFEDIPHSTATPIAPQPYRHPQFNSPPTSLSGIEYWLSTIQDPSTFAIEENELTSNPENDKENNIHQGEGRGTKRCRFPRGASPDRLRTRVEMDHGADLDLRPRKRRLPIAATGTAIATAAAEKPAFSRTRPELASVGEHRYTRRTHNQVVADVAEWGEEDEEDHDNTNRRSGFDLDATPRSNTQSADARSLSRTRSVAEPPLLFTTSPAISTTSSSATSQKSIKSRSRSPTKVGMFERSNLPVVFVPFTAPDTTHSSLADQLRYDIEDIVEDGNGVVPPFLVRHLNPTTNRLRERHKAKEWSDEAWPPDEMSSRIKEILWNASFCQTKRVTESAWNAEVHTRVLNMALSGKWLEQGIWYRDVTSARVDKALLPTINDVTIESQLVDYCIVIEKPGWKARIVRKLNNTRLESINHSTTEYLWDVPISVSIETKRGGDGELKANNQLGIWVSAHFRQLQQLAPTAVLPVLPLLYVQGHYWRLMLAEYQPAVHRVQIFQYLDMGNTTSALSFCKLLASLRCIAKYVDEVYVPWFEAHVLFDVR